MGDADAAAATMKVDPARAAALAANLQAVQARVLAAAGTRPVRLVAVSKLKPANDVLALHTGAVRQVHFGENYAQELRDKAALLPASIQWHFIGGLQSNHCKILARVPNLWCVSSIDSERKARLLDTARAATATVTTAPTPIHIHVQVNTSGEAAKSGCAPGADTVALCRAIVADCPHLRLLGLMTIGSIARSRAVAEAGPDDENPDFVLLRAQRDLVAAALASDARDTATTTPAIDARRPAVLELSMGMSDDFVSAIASGSGEVRIGSTIFGVRPAKADAQLTV